MPQPDSPKATTETVQSKNGAVVLPNSRGVMPCKIVFLSGPYKGKPLNLGNGIVKSDHNQEGNWRSQDGRSLRTGSSFVNISPREFNLTLEFYSPNEDITPWAENVMTLQEIDPQTGFAPTLSYTEGDIKSVAPVVCRSVKIAKEHPFPGSKGFHYAKVDVRLELLGGKNSANRFAPPLCETELTGWAKSKTEAEKAREGTIAVSQESLAKCLTPADNEQLVRLLQSNQAGNPGALSQLSNSALVQAAVAGLIPKEALGQLGDKLNDAIAQQIAAKTSGVGKNVDALKAAIQTGNVSGLPQDLADQVADLQTDYAAIKTAIADQNLDKNAPVYNRGTTANTLIKIASCGVQMRQSGASGVSKDQSNPPEWEDYFKAKLGDRASDQVARDQFVNEQVNKTLSDGSITNAQLVEKFGLANEDQAKKLRNSQPFKSKDDFIRRSNASGAIGRSIWASFIESEVASSQAIANPVTQ